VQVTKDAIGTKGPTLSTNISIPGRYLVLMPSLQRWGVSRKIDDEAERRRLKALMEELSPPPGMGFIVRTAGIDKTKADMARDLRYLLRLWSVIVKRIRENRGPSLIYRESDLVTRILRDTYGTDVEEIVVDTEDAARTCRDFLGMFAPRAQTSVRFHQGRKPVFYRYGVEHQIERMFDRKIDLPSGGSIVIDQTEALVAIDVNSGKYRQEEHLEETAFRINMEAVVEIARQIRLRDLGGVIINDLIDMRQDRHRREVERAFRAALKDDRARIKMVRISPLGIIEMTRQRVWPNMDRTFQRACPRCGGSGAVKTEDYVMQRVLRRVLWSVAQPATTVVDVRASVRLAERLSKARKSFLSELERESGKSIRILPDSALGDSEAEVTGLTQDGRKTPGPRSGR
jgi:ribonuclease E